MDYGKNICNQLKEVRRRIAEENDIPLEIKECIYQGPCSGTCPYCDSEVRYLENALVNRLRLGKVATVAGLALGLASTAAEAAETCPALPSVPQHIENVSVPEVDSVTVKCMVVDQKTKEPLPFVNVIVLKDGVELKGAITDLDGNCSLMLAPGRYTFKMAYVGYYTYLQEVSIDKDRNLDIELKATGKLMGEVMVGIVDRYPLIEIGPEGSINTEIQDVHVKIQY